MQPRDLSDHAAYRPGRGVASAARNTGLDPGEFAVLSSNENALGPSTKAVEAIREVAATAHRYPKSSHVDLTRRIAEKWVVAPEQVWLASGGVGSLDYVTRAMLEPGDAVLVPHPGFGYYAMTARFHHGRVRSYGLDRANDYDQGPEAVLSNYSGERIVFLISPHNPIGTRSTVEEIETIATETAEETLVVVDEAYGEYHDGPSARELLEERDDVAVMRTFSKAYGLAGCRVGYLLVPGGWADAVARVQTPFAASEIACRAALAAIEDSDHVDRSVELARWSRSYMHAEIEARTWQSSANFVLAQVGDGEAVAHELEQRGVLVRHTTHFGLTDCVRITCGTREDTRRAVDELNAVLQSGLTSDPQSGG